MSKYAQGVFVPTNPEKYIGKGSIKYRSSWEFAFMSLCDKHPSIIQWASESIRIPYYNPLTKKTNNIYSGFLYCLRRSKSKKTFGIN